MASLRNLLFFISALSLIFIVTAKSFEFDNTDLASDQTLRDLYQRWRSYHNVSDHLSPRISLDENPDHRFGVFKENVQHIHVSNQMNKPYKLKLNSFADMTNEEFVSAYTGTKVVPRRPLVSSSRRASPGTFEHGLPVEKNVPQSIDWRELGAVTGVKNQGLCGSCWAFSAIAAVEGINQIKTKKLISLSEQELVDCDTTNYGCEGGLMELAFDFIKKNGIATENKYPYLAKSESCNAAAEVVDRGVTIDGYEKVRPNENALLKAVARQPVSVSIDAGGKDLQFYSKGVFTGHCGTELNHGVAMVGYGTTGDGKKYWTVKNSWGTKWGEKGYIRLERGVRKQFKQGKCGVAMDSAYPILKTNSN